MLANGVEVLVAGNPDASPQVQQGPVQRLNRELVASSNEDNVVALLNVKRFANLPGQGHLPTTSHFCNRHGNLII